MRLTYEQLNMIKEKMGVDMLWSFSKMSTYLQCSWLYKLKYIDKIRLKGDNCYTHFGTVSHDVIQGLYDEVHTYEQMIDKFNEEVIKWQINDDPALKFNSDKERDGYIENLRHYFTHTEQIPYKVVNEKAVLAVFEGAKKYVFQGYIDSQYTDEDGIFYILDYKTSSKSGFTGKDLLKKAQQLMIYAVGINQFHKIPIDKIRLRYDMMKYCNVSFMQKNGKMKTTKAERSLWVAHISNQLRKDFEDVEKSIEKHQKEIAKIEKKIKQKKTTPEMAEEYLAMIKVEEESIKELEKLVFNPLEINEMMDKAMNDNTLENLPQFIQDKYTVENCYIDVELTEEIVEEFKAELVSVLDKIIAKTEEGNADEAFDRSRIDNSNSFYCNTLCDMKSKCKFYEEYKENSSMFIEKKVDQPSDEEIMAMFGLS
ncbi:TPA: PD-(D/E)XK nuclease family protein [Bacillus cereus]